MVSSWPLDPFPSSHNSITEQFALKSFSKLGDRFNIVVWYIARCYEKGDELSLFCLLQNKDNRANALLSTTQRGDA